MRLLHANLLVLTALLLHGIAGHTEEHQVAYSLAEIDSMEGEAISEFAVIVTGEAIPEQCLSSVAVKEIDGENVTVSGKRFGLEPGVHSMNGFSNLDTTFCPVVHNAPGFGIPDLEAEFEAGKVYYVGLDHGFDDRSEWKLVIWKVEQDGVQVFPAREDEGYEVVP